MSNNLDSGDSASVKHGVTSRVRSCGHWSLETYSYLVMRMFLTTAIASFARNIIDDSDCLDISPKLRIYDTAEDII